MQLAQLIGLSLGNACKAFRMFVMQSKCYQHRYLQPQILPTARSLRVLLGLIAHEHEWGLFGPPIPTRMRFQHPFQNPRYVEVSTSQKRRPNFADDAAPPPETLRSVGASLNKRVQKNTLSFNTQNPFPNRGRSPVPQPLKAYLGGMHAHFRKDRVWEIDFRNCFSRMDLHWF